MARSGTGLNDDWLENTTAVLTAVPIGMFAWVNPADVTSYQTPLLIGGSVGNDWFVLGLWGHVAGDAVTAYVGSGGTGEANASSTVGFTANTWQAAHAGFYSNTSRAAGLNGGNVGTNTTSMTPTAGNLNRTSVGFRVGGTTYGPLNGQVAEAAIWDLTDWGADAASRRTAFEAIWPALAAGYAPTHWPRGLRFYAPLHGNASPEPDYAGGRSLTVNGAIAKADHPRIIYPTGLEVAHKAGGGGPPPAGNRRRRVLLCGSR